MIMLIVIGAVAVFYWYEFEKQEEKIFKLEREIYELKHAKDRTMLMMIADLVNEYKKGENPYTILASISNVIKKEELDTDQSN